MKKLLTLFFAALLLFSFAASAMAFTDDNEIKYPLSVNTLAEAGLLSGFPDGSFRPDAPLTRGQMAKLAAFLVNDGDISDSYAAACPFPDTVGTWQAKYAAFGAEKNILTGDGTNFFPENNVTGYEAEKIVLLASGLSSKAYTGAGWDDAVSADAKALGLLDGLEDLDESRPISREEVAKMICNACFRPEEPTPEAPKDEYDGKLTGIIYLPANTEFASTVDDCYLYEVYNLYGGKTELVCKTSPESISGFWRLVEQKSTGYYELRAVTGNYTLAAGGWDNETGMVEGGTVDYIYKALISVTDVHNGNTDIDDIDAANAANIIDLHDTDDPLQYNRKITSLSQLQQRIEAGDTVEVSFYCLEDEGILALFINNVVL